MFDAEGNLTQDGKNYMLWDEENRLQAVSVKGIVSSYSYDGAGERVVKLSGGKAQDIHVNSEFSGKNSISQGEYTVYANPYFVTNHKGEYSKHYYIGSQRVLSKLGDGTTYDNEDPRRTAKAGFSVDETDKPDYENLWAKANEREVTKHDSLGVPFVMPKNHANIFAQNGRATENQYYFYHPDHLGSSSYVSYTDGEIAQHTEYAPFGEVLLDETNRNWNTPWLFNGKELDEETGYYYYGARYYNPKVSNWLSVDPIALYDPIDEIEHYLDGQHNGGYFNSRNMSVYGYTYQNPIIYVDPNGKQSYFQYLPTGLGSTFSSLENLTQKAINWSDKKVEQTKQNIKTTVKNAQNFVTKNKEIILEVADQMQETGDSFTVGGILMSAAGTPVAGVGALPGAGVAIAGRITSYLGSGLEILTETIAEDGNLNNAANEGSWLLGGELLDKSIDAFLPGPTPDVPIESKDMLKGVAETMVIGVENSTDENL